MEGSMLLHIRDVESVDVGGVVHSGEVLLKEKRGNHKCERNTQSG